MHPTGKFVIELRGLVNLLQNAIGDTYSPDCSTDLFSEKCKLRSSALGRIAGKYYDVGDRVTVPTTSTPGAYALPFVNLDFQNLHYADSPAWSLSQMVARLPQGEALRMLSPMTWVSSFHQTVQINTSTLDGTFALPLLAEVTSHSFGEGLQYRLRMTFFDEDQVEISSVSTVYRTLNNLETRTLDALTPPGTWFVTYYVETRKDPLTEANFTTNEDTRFYSPRLQRTGYDDNLLVDPQFLTFSLATATVVGWNPGSWLSAYLMRQAIAGPNGKPFMMRSIGGIVRTGPVSLTGGPVSASEIDTGDYVLDLSWYQANIDLNGAADLQATFFGPTLPVDGIATNWDLQEIVPTGSWKTRKKTLAIPAGARTVSLGAQFTKPQSAIIDSDSMAAIADISASIRSIYDVGYNFASYGGVEYVATTAGTTDSAQAYDWSRLVGDTVSDGTVTWEVALPQWSNLTTLASVTSRGIFTLGAEVARADEFFQWGMIVFLDGPNAGFTADIAKYVASTRRIELALPLPFVPEVGDQVWVQVGCDKRVVTCQGKFGNAINFRGFPRLPGTDQYFKIGSPL